MTKNILWIQSAKIGAMATSVKEKLTSGYSSTAIILPCMKIP